LSSFQHNFGALPEIETSDKPLAYEALTHFYGSCLAVIGLTNLVTGWFFYSRAVLRFGVNTLILITPFAFLITYSGWQFDSSLALPLFGLFVVESLMPIVEDNNFNLLLNAVPLKLKSKVRVVIESFSEPCGMLLSAILLSTLFFDWKILGLTFALLSLSAALLIRKQYTQAIFANLKDHALHLYKTAAESLNSLSKKERKAAEEKLIRLAKENEPQSQKLALETILATNKSALLERAIKEVFFLEEAKIHLVVLAEQNDLKDPFLIQTFKQWREEPMSRQGHARLDFFLAKVGLLSHDMAETYLHSDLMLERGAAIIRLSRTFAHQSEEAAYSRLQA
ncbi:MAG TPA: hypothetical protein VN457_03460, partial [Chlamydiales bacterium]|nr:hypothetical protein [Chlamydiales bacterium]